MPKIHPPYTQKQAHPQVSKIYILGGPGDPNSICDHKSADRGPKTAPHLDFARKNIRRARFVITKSIVADRGPRLMFHVKQFSNEKKLGLLATNMAHALVASAPTADREKRSENSGLRTV